MNSERPDNDDATRDAGSGTGRAARRRSPGVAAVSVAAAVLLIGGGGAVLAATSSGGGPDGGRAPGASRSAPEPLALDDLAAPADGTAAAEGGGSGPGIAPGEPDPRGVVYRAARPLPGGPRSAPVYAAREDVTAAEVARLAGALGVEGTPRVQGGAWKVGTSGDGFGPLLTVNVEAPGFWTFQRHAPGTDNCGTGPVCKAPSTGGTPVGEGAAVRAAAPVLEAVGQEGAAVDASQLMGARRVVNVEPEVGGLPTYGWTTGVVVGPLGEVVGGSGRLKAPAEADTYPVLNAERTLELLNAQGAAAPDSGSCAEPVPLREGTRPPCAPPAAVPDERTVTVEEAVFGLAAHSVRGRQALVPSWLYQVRTAGTENTFTVTYPAVEPSHLAPPAGAGTAPSGEPETTPAEPAAPASPRGVQVTGYTAEGSELTVHFIGGVCADYAAAARADDRRVTVTVTETPRPGGACILVAREYTRTVTLDRPLGDRGVVGSDGAPVPPHKPGARLPAEAR
ncbi:hypothetical protein [Streptomyces sp. SID8352]|uniref:hypothetical protein n=1 Tax=Streptomyces sp. SID8352 TaxID=2690338 RepID=UPI001370A57F|nr:hypothetical protein [Streptomyces sp. SID8352]